MGITSGELRLYLALEYANGGNLKQWLAERGGRLLEPVARWFTQQLVYGLAYCHAHGVFNRCVLENETKRPCVCVRKRNETPVSAPVCVCVCVLEITRDRTNGGGCGKHQPNLKQASET